MSNTPHEGDVREGVYFWNLKKATTYMFLDGEWVDLPKLLLKTKRALEYLQSLTSR